MQVKSVVIVTGASQGIGRATAIRLARDFEGVVLAARQEDELEKTADAVKAAGANLCVMRSICARQTRPRSSSFRARSIVLPELMLW
jgi:NADP-dependent 3-hydroxy acid dehydrogenase YdfG